MVLLQLGTHDPCILVHIRLLFLNVFLIEIFLASPCVVSVPYNGLEPKGKSWILFAPSFFKFCPTRYFFCLVSVANFVIAPHIMCAFT